MIFNGEKHSFPSKDDFFAFYYFLSYIKRKIEFNKEKNPSIKEEVKLRNHSVKNKIIKNNNFLLNHNILCLSICGKTCKMENHKFRRIPTPIEGLNCDQIDDFLFASQRLTNRTINQFNLIKRMKELNIGLIVNCELKGEHPFCGDPYYDGLDASGFAYSIPLLEKSGIDVLLCGWNDLTIPDTFNHVIKIVKKIYYYINKLNKKVLVHCHAGFGRTAIVLACYYIFSKTVKAEKARKLIRKGGRKRCLGSQLQFNYCREFEKYLEISRANFYDNKKDLTILKINEKFLKVSEYKLKYFGDDNFIEYVPIFLLYIFDRIIQIINNNKIDEDSINNLYNYNINKEEEVKAQNIINEINKYNFEEINICENIKILGYLLFKWLNNSVKYVIDKKVILNINETNYSSEYENMKDSDKSIFKCIGKFLGFFNQNESLKNSEKLKEFFNQLFSSLIGTSKENENSQEKKKTVEKLNNYFQFIIKKNHY